MNVQETFWSSYAAGHLDLADVWLDFAYRMLPKAEAYTRQVSGTRGAFQTSNQKDGVVRTDAFQLERGSRGTGFEP